MVTAREKWTRWEPINGLSGKYYLDYFAWSEKGFVVELISGKKEKRIQILFDDYIDSFRYTNESFCFKIFGDLSDQYGDDFYGDWSFFKVTNSEYLKWLSDKSRTWSDQIQFIHFCILGGDEVIDIVTNYEPKVRFIEYKPKVNNIE
ncbi:MAG: hypothetical protein WC747_01920 [Candidatus Babeliales bacterium]|jgi:hypothetical protein